MPKHAYVIANYTRVSMLIDGVFYLQEQQTALHIASRLGNVDIVGILLQHGAAVDSVTKDSYTALHIAAKEGQEEVASLLLDHGAQLTATTKVCCSRLLLFVFQFSRLLILGTTERLHSTSLVGKVWQHQSRQTPAGERSAGRCTGKGKLLKLVYRFTF